MSSTNEHSYLPNTPVGTTLGDSLCLEFLKNFQRIKFQKNRLMRLASKEHKKKWLEIILCRLHCVDYIVYSVQFEVSFSGLSNGRQINFMFSSRSLKAVRFIKWFGEFTW